MTDEGGDGIVLVGMMGCGKSSVGAVLADCLGRELIDLDSLVELAAGRSIARVFEAEGEAGFRGREAQAVTWLAQRPGAVVACGGGVVLDPANVAALRAYGTVVWLDVTPEVAADRLGSAEGRPVLAAMAGDLPARVATLTAERRPAYEGAADLRVDADHDPDVVADAILQALRERGGTRR